MRPLHLTMQAVGPYPNRAVIDFRDAVEAGLFGIYGPTGSGKSTIFSAITFALFGESAKQEQDTPSMRSDHASASVKTEIEFVFEIGTRRYVVLRRPDQSRPKLRGGGETQTKHEAFLFDATGIALEDIKGGRKGKPLAEKKVRAVDQEIEEKLGYGAKQFRQIVLLPQGRFEAFLSAKTNERLEILRDLFDVSLYQRLAEKLKADANNEEEKMQKIIEAREVLLSAEGFESTDALAQGIRDAQNEHGLLLEQEKAADAELKAIQTAFQKALNEEEKFKAAEEAARALASLQEEKGDMDGLKEQVKKADQAKSLLDVENAVISSLAEMEEANKNLATAKENESKAKERDSAATTALKNEEARESEITDMQNEMQNLERFKSVLEKSTVIRAELAEAQDEQEKAKTALQNAEGQLVEYQNDKRNKEAAVKVARKASEERNKITSEITALKTSHAAAVAYATARNAVKSATGARADLNAKHESAKNAAEQTKAEYDKAEKALSDVQALHLASKLSAGEACPVCGSTEHPFPATGTAEHEGLDEAFRTAKKAWEGADKAMQEAKNALAGADSVLKEREENLGNLPEPLEPADSLEAKIKAQEAAIKDLGPEVNINDAEKEIEGLDGKIDTQDKDCGKKRNELSEKQQAVASVKARLEEALDSVPEELREGDALEIKIEETGNALEQRKEQLNQVRKDAAEAKNGTVAASKELEGATKALDVSKERHERANSTFMERLNSRGISQKEFEDIKPFIETVDEDRETVAEYDRNMRNAEESVKKTAAEIKELTRPDIANLEERQTAAEQKHSQSIEIRAQAEKQVADLIKLRDDLAETMRRLEEAEVASGPLRNLAALTNGENPHRMTLETFAIGAMFDDVLNAANQRLAPMTGSRYSLEREVEGSGRGRRGLGIQVSDTYTGKTRSTTTLSGGEGFIAALALALGLADVVESASGKVRLDTIFIDEGFGSLDTENDAGTLQQVLDSLVKQKRSVGLISHVPLVQEAVPNGFYIRKSPAGISTIEPRGIV